MAEAEVSTSRSEGEFDPKAHARASKELKALKKANLKAVFGSGVGRISLFVFGAASMLLLSIGAYKLFGGRAPIPTAPASSANEAILSGQVAVSDTTVGTENEAQMRETLYRRQAAAARAGGQPYIAPPINRDDAVVAAQQPAAKPFTDQPKPATPASSEVDLANTKKNQGQGAAPNQPSTQGNTVNIQEMVTRVKKEDVMPQVLTALGKDDVGKSRSTFSTGVYAVAPKPQAQVVRSPATQSVAPGTAAATAGGVAATTNQCSVPLFQAGDGCYGILRYGINTDYPGKNAFATLYQCKGIAKATVIGKYDETDQNVGVTFDKLAIPGRPMVSIQALAIDDATWGTGLADDVDNHYARRFVGTGLAAIMTGIGKAASMAQGTVSTTGYAGSTTTVITQEPISAERQLKMALGEVGTVAGAEMKRQNDSLKATKRVNSEKNIGIVFLNDVCEEKK